MTSRLIGTGSSAFTLLAALLVPTSTAQTTRPVFEVASIKPTESRPAGGRQPSPDVFYRPGATLAALIQFAYGVEDVQVLDGPDWIRRDRFAVNAKAASVPSDNQMQLMVQSLLEDRFKLVARTDRREMRLENLVLARNDGRPGSRLVPCEDRANLPPPRPLVVPPGSAPFRGRCRELSALVGNASTLLGVPVVDRTGLSGLWSWDLVYLQNQPLSPGVDTAGTPVFRTALQEELGLKLEPGRGPVEVIVIESAQRPQPD